MQTNYKIRGHERRKLKKELHNIKYSNKMIWYFNDIDIVYGGGFSSDEIVQIIEKNNNDIKLIEGKLNEKIN